MEFQHALEENRRQLMVTFGDTNNHSYIESNTKIIFKQYDKVNIYA